MLHLQNIKYLMSLNVKLTYLPSYPYKFNRTSSLHIYLTEKSDSLIPRRILPMSVWISLKLISTMVSNSDIEDYTNLVLILVILGLIPSWPQDRFWRNHSSTKLVQYYNFRYQFYSYKGSMHTLPLVPFGSFFSKQESDV